MKRFFTIFLFLTCAFAAHAFEVADSFTYNTDFWRNSSVLILRPSYALSVGAEFDITEHDYFDNHIYALRLPVALKLEDTSFILRPFYYPGNGNNAEALGARAIFSSLIKRDDIENAATRFHLAAAFAAQKADLVKNGAHLEQEDFYQAAYELNLNFAYFEQYFFDITGNIFQYPSGIDGVDAVGGVMNQTELADLGTMHYVLGQPFYSAGARIRWLSQVSSSDNYISYRYINFYHETSAQSLMFASTIRLSKKFFINLAYNHIFRSGADDDLYSAGAMLKF